MGWLGALMGGRGMASAAICALLALFSIFAGKVFAVYCVVQSHDAFEEKEAKAELDVVFGRSVYETHLAAGEQFQLLKSEEEYPAFMIQQGFTEADDPQKVSSVEIMEFKKEYVSYLRELHADKPTYDAWRKKMEQKTAEAITLDPAILVEAVVENLGFADILFAFLGLATAFQLGRGKEQPVAAVAPQ
ncbi:MAG: hypothetical protein A2Z34_02490 [Planctomycetes bacterium RBG_16_59_8]|nr:MAG: hypothetical protein A2Z34_02490 [Planctomycetes bacterium RBG_16_59_8]